MPLQSRAKQPPTLGVYETLRLIQEEKVKQEEKEAEEGDAVEVKEVVYTCSLEEERIKRALKRKEEHLKNLEECIATCTSPPSPLSRLV